APITRYTTSTFCLEIRGHLANFIRRGCRQRRHELSCDNRLLRQPHGLEGLGMIEVLRCSDNLAVAKGVDHRQVPVGAHTTPTAQPGPADPREHSVVAYSDVLLDVGVQVIKALLPLFDVASVALMTMVDGGVGVLHRRVVLDLGIEELRNQRSKSSPRLNTSKPPPARSPHRPATCSALPLPRETGGVKALFPRHEELELADRALGEVRADNADRLPDGNGRTLDPPAHLHKP